MELGTSDSLVPGVGANPGRDRAFLEAPVALWIEDFSRASMHLTRLRARGIKDLSGWFDEHPKEFAVLVRGMRIVDCNPAAARMLRFPDPETLLSRLRDVFLPGTEAALRAKLTALFEGHPEIRIETPLQRSDGDIIEVLVNIRLPAEGEPRDAVIVSTTDITSRVKSERALRESEQRLDLALWGADLGVWESNFPDGTSYFNDRWYRMLGYEPGELGNDITTWQDLVHEDDKALVTEALAAHLEGRTPYYQCEHRLRAKDGSWRWVLGSGRVTARAEDGSPLRASGTNQDITPYKQAQEVLLRGERRFRDLVEHAPIGVALATMKGQLQLVNPALCRMLGYTELELLGMTIQDLTLEADWPTTEATLEKIEAGSRGPFTHEKRYRTKNGEIAWGRVNLFVVELEDKRDRGIVAHIQDVTLLRTAEEERRVLAERVQQSQKLESLGVLAGGIAHDFNNLLVAIIGNAGLARMKLGAMSPADGNLEDIESASNRAAELTQQMLAYSGGGAFLVEPVDLGAVIEGIKDLLEIATRRSTTLELRLAADLPAFEADVTQIRQLLLNLVTNAAEAVGDEGGKVTITTGVMLADRHALAHTYVDDELPSGHYVYVEVQDDGGGMAPEVRERAFEPFFTTKQAGRGLGLAASLGIVRSHRGAIQLDSDGEQGTRIRVMFPTTQESVARDAEHPDGPPASAPDRCTVLVIDDEQGVRAVAGESLRCGGYKAITAKDGEEGLRVYEERRAEIDVVLLDMTMPGLSGLQVLEKLRALDPAVAVILSSGHTREAALAQVGDNPPGFLKKPYLPQKLIHTVKEFMATT
jgi:PAS domain S-box-containing protein